MRFAAPAMENAARRGRSAAGGIDTVISTPAPADAHEFVDAATCLVFDQWLTASDGEHDAQLCLDALGHRPGGPADHFWIWLSI
jgi:hypothetical protein